MGSTPRKPYDSHNPLQSRISPLGSRQYFARQSRGSHRLEEPYPIEAVFILGVEYCDKQAIETLNILYGKPKSTSMDRQDVCRENRT